MEPVAADGASSLDLRGYLRILGRRKWIVLLTVLVCATVAFALAYRKDDRYRATAELLLLAPSALEADVEALSEDAERAIANEIQILGSKEMRDAVRAELGPGTPNVSASGGGDNDVITLTATGRRPGSVATAINVYARTYTEVRTQRLVDRLNSELIATQTDRSNALTTIDSVREPLVALDERIAALPPGPEQQQLITERQQLQEGLQNQLNMLDGTVAQSDNRIAQIQGAIENPSGGVEILNPATPPSEPYFPQPRKDAMVGAVLGLLLGLAIVVVWEQLDDTIRSSDDLGRALPDLPILGSIPYVEQSTASGLVVRDQPLSPAAEAYRTLAAALEFIASDPNVRVVQVTSALPAEGKTTTITNLAVTMAETSTPTIVVDADLRRPRVHDVFAVANSVGLTNVLTSQIDLADAGTKLDEIGPLSVLPAGPSQPNPSPLIHSDLMSDSIVKLRESATMVMTDTPPVLAASDGLVIARHVDAAILVVRSGQTGRRAVRRAVGALQTVEAPLIGAVLNGVSPDDGYQTEYGYYYEDEDGKSRRGRKNESRRRKRRRRKKYTRTGG